MHAAAEFRAGILSIRATMTSFIGETFFIDLLHIVISIFLFSE